MTLPLQIAAVVEEKEPINNKEWIHGHLRLKESVKEGFIKNMVVENVC